MEKREAFPRPWSRGASTSDGEPIYDANGELVMMVLETFGNNEELQKLIVKSVNDAYADGEAMDPAEVCKELFSIQFPPALRKATEDSFVYAAYIRGCGTVVFSYAEVITDEWVRLHDVVPSYGEDWVGRQSREETAVDAFQFSFDRGLEVRVSDIVWVADAPWGS